MGKEANVITVRLEPELYEALRRTAFDAHRPMNVIVREALRERLGVK